MAEVTNVDGRGHDSNDRLLSLLALIAAAAGLLGIVFAYLDWSHARLAAVRSSSFTLLLFVFALASLFLTYLLGLWLLTHDKRRIRNTLAEAAAYLAVGAIVAFIIR